MDFKFTTDDESFRQEVRSFIRANLPQDIAEDVSRWFNPRMCNYRRWQRILSRPRLGSAALAARVRRHGLECDP